MAKLAKHFTVTKHLPNKASIEFSGIVYKDDCENYDIEDVRFHTFDSKGEIVENITQWFFSFRALNDPEFHHEDICELLFEWLQSDEAKPNYSQLNEAA